MNKHRMMQYIGIAFILTVAAGGWFYFSSNAAQKINSSKVNSLTSGLVGYWTFDGADTSWSSATEGTVADKSPIGANIGTLTSMSQSASPTLGKIGQAFNFDGNADYVTIPTSASLDISAIPVTLSAWIYPATVANSNRQIVGTGPDSDMGYGIWLDNNKIRLGRHGGGSTLSVTTLNANQWYHVVGIINGSGSKMYIDGNPDSSTPSITIPGSFSLPIIIGAIHNSPALPTNFFQGKIDEVRIYNTALSQSEITELYQQGQTKINASQVNELTSGLTGYWSFDGNSVDWSQVNAEIRETSSGNKCTSAPCHGNAIIMTNSSAVPGKIGQGLNFNSASSQYISTAGQTRDSLLGLREGTVSAWVRPTGAPVNTTGDMWNLPAVVSEMSNASFGIHRGTVSSGSDKIWAYNSWEDTAIVGTTFTTGEWTHIIFLKTATQLCIYKNGAEVECQNSTARISAGALNIGKAYGVEGAGAYFNGDIDELRTYNRTLSQSEITELYQQGQTKINTSQDGKLESGLVAYYTMDGADTAWATTTTGTVTDKSPVGTNTGTLTSMSQSTSPAIGKIGQALYFDGSNDYIVKAGATGLPQGNNSFSISVWTKPAKGAANYMVSWGYPNYGNNLWNAFVVTGSKLYHLFYGNDLPGGTTLIVNGSTWYHAVVTYDKDTNLRKIYLNGTVDASAVPSNGTPAVDGSELLIATDPVGDFIGKGTLDEVRVYNRAITQSEVTELYNLGR